MRKDDVHTGSPLFVLNEKGNDISVVHTSDCATIQHQVQRAVRWEDTRTSHEHGGYTADGDAIVIEKHHATVSHYTPLFVTADDLVAWSKKYRRCQHCSPDVPESPRTHGDPTVRLRARSLSDRHLGREFVGIGRLVAVTMSAAGFEISGDTGTMRVPLDGYLEYRKASEPPAETR